MNFIFRSGDSKIEMLFRYLKTLSRLANVSTPRSGRQTASARFTMQGQTVIESVVRANTRESRNSLVS